MLNYFILILLFLVLSPLSYCEVQTKIGKDYKRVCIKFGPDYLRATVDHSLWKSCDSTYSLPSDDIVEFTDQEVFEYLKNDIYSSFKLVDKSDLSIELLSSSNGAKKTRAGLVFVDISEMYDVKPRLPIRLSVFNNNMYQNTTIWLKVKYLVESLKAKRNHTKLESVYSEDFRKDKVDYFSLNCKPIVPDFDNFRYILVSDVSRGDILCFDEVEELKAVNSNQRVNLSVVGNGLKFKLEAIALKSGEVGETIRVKELLGGKEIEVKVVSNKMVHYDFKD